ncbi:hypothetical protein GYMLUDRAFT_962934 [Collybiopsis luxurians FD-317 M1]|uniref:Uncharacterized protein n=1 Tax=Collybiopsis luxurians FD-317 M1 TaxID=944289 RepID=A0A0D0BSZ2_9AGAR|nr:hypothetical protein GYMLUDRAFT_962934 [Collybiopsis luxurians FD-317 M1]
MKRLGESSVTQVIIRDGSAYFLIMLIVAILNTIGNLINLLTESPANSFFNLIVPFFEVLPNMLISRLVLNLHTFSASEETSRSRQSAERQQYSGLHFATNSFLGNIGAPLDGGTIEEEEE